MSQRLAGLVPRTVRPFLLGLGLALATTALWAHLAAAPPTLAQGPPSPPDSGVQRDRMIQELAAANQKLAEMTEILKEIRDGKTGEKPPRANPRP